MTLEGELLALVDKALRNLETTRSEFTPNALREVLNHHTVSMLEQRHRRGYEFHPVKKDEFRVWDNEQNWGDK